ACIGLLFIVDVNVPNTEPARENGRPESSSAAIVFSNVAASLLSAIALISARDMSMPFSSAGLKSTTLTFSNGGTPPYGPVHGANNGSDGIFAPPLANESLLLNESNTADAPADKRNVRLCMTGQNIARLSVRVRSVAPVAGGPRARPMQPPIY